MTRAAIALRRWGTPPATRPPLPLLAVAAGVAVLALLPLVWLALRALGGDAQTLELLLRPRTAELLVSTAILGAGTAAGALLFGLPIAWLTVRTDLPGRRAWEIAAIAPLAVPSYLLAFAFVAALGPRGWIADLLAPLGVGALPILDGPFGAILVLSLATMPFVVLSASAALRRLDAASDEVARSLGDGPVAAFRTAVLPRLLPAAGAGALLAALYAISDFGAPAILRYDSLARAIYTQVRSSFDRASASALALLLVGLALVCILAEARARRSAALRTPREVRRTPARIPLGRWRIPALVFCAAVASLALVLPVVTVAVWLVRGLAGGAEVALDLSALRDSLVLATSAALLAVTVALPLAWLVVRHHGRAGVLAERLAWLVEAMPGISFALAVVSLTLTLVPALYQSLAALVVSVALRFLVQPVGALRAPILQVGPHLEEAARSLGDARADVVRRVVLPLLRPGIAAGAALVFLGALKELPLTLLVAPTGFATLATELWDAAREGFFAQAALPAALLLVVASASLALLVRGAEARR